MKSIKVVYFLILTGVLFSFCAANSSEPGSGENEEPSTAENNESPTSTTVKRYGIESGIIEYEVSGMQTGTETVYFTDWGLKEAKFTNTVMEVAGFTQETNSLTIMIADVIYNIDLNTNQGTMLNNTFMTPFLEGDTDLQEIGEQMMEGMGGSITGTEEVAGKMCDVWEVSALGSKTWVWEWITLKTEVNMMGMEQINTATSVQANVDVSDDYFDVSEYEITELGDFDNIMDQY